MKALTIEQLTVGQSASFSRNISEHDIYEFAGITGDLNPAHINEEYARNTHFRGRIAHGILSAGLISAAIAMQLPGPGSIYLGQTLKFTAPVRIGDTITATVTITELNTGKNRVKLHTVCTNQEGAVVIDGEASVMPPK